MFKFVSSKIEFTADEQERRPFAAQIAKMAHSSFAEPVHNFLISTVGHIHHAKQEFSKLFSDAYIWDWISCCF